MLENLHVKNLALIEEQEITFYERVKYPYRGNR